MSQQITGCIVQNTVLIHGGMILPFILTKSAPGETFRADSLQYFIFHVPIILSQRQVVVILPSSLKKFIVRPEIMAHIQGVLEQDSKKCLDN
jgi:hypothetical protein